MSSPVPPTTGPRRSADIKPLAQRADWIDHVKGITITLVVAHHVLSGLHTTFGLPSVMYWYQISSPVRMPLFFLVAGLFARKALHIPLRDFLDSKILHFAYFYLLWSVITFAFRYTLNPITNQKIQGDALLWILWDPLGTIWFLYALLIAFALARLTRSIPPAYQIAFAALLQAASLNTDMFEPFHLIDQFGKLFVYFLIGLHASEWIRERAPRTQMWQILLAGAAFAALGVTARLSDVIMDPLVHFLLSALSAFVIIGLSVAAVRAGWGGLFRFVGENSLYIYLTHFIPAAGVRIVLLAVGITNPALIFPVAVAGSVAFGIVFFYTVRTTVFRFLVERPVLFRLRRDALPRLAVAAEGK